MTQKLKTLANLILSRLYTRETLLLYRFRQKQEIHSEARIDIANFENIGDLKAFQTSAQISKFREFLENGDVGYLGYLGDQCVHRSWVVVHRRVVNLHWAVPYSLEEGDAYIHYCETAPSARGKKVYPAVLSRICSDLGDKFNILINVNKENTASISGIEKVGFERIKENRILVIFGVKFLKTTCLENRGAGTR